MATAMREVNLRVVRNFLNLPIARRREIQGMGTGVYCLCIPGRLIQYPKDQYPVLYSRRWPTVRTEIGRYIVLANLCLGDHDALSEIPGSVWIPFTIAGQCSLGTCWEKSIEEYMS